MLLQGQEFLLRQTAGGWRAISKGKLVPAKRVHTFLCKAFGEKLGPVRAALRALGVKVSLGSDDKHLLLLYDCDDCAARGICAAQYFVVNSVLAFFITTCVPLYLCRFVRITGGRLHFFGCTRYLLRELYSMFG